MFRLLGADKNVTNTTVLSYLVSACCLFFFLYYWFKRRHRGSPTHTHLAPKSQLSPLFRRRVLARCQSSLPLGGSASMSASTINRRRHVFLDVDPAHLRRMHAVWCGLCSLLMHERPDIGHGRQRRAFLHAFSPVGAIREPRWGHGCLLFHPAP